MYGNALYDPSGLFEKWKEMYNQDIDFTNLEFAVLTQKVLASGGYGWDVASVLQAKPLYDEGIYHPIPVEKIPRWNPEKILSIIPHPEDYFEPIRAKRFEGLTWIEKGKILGWVPFIYGIDSIAYLPEFLPYEEHGAKEKTLDTSELWNPEWKGKVGLFPWSNEALGFVANYLEWTDQMTLESYPHNMTKDEIDKVYNFLLPIIKSGQIKVMWFKYGDAVTLLSTKEIYLTLCIEPIVFDVRTAGTPTYYANLKDGLMLWINGQVISPHVNPDVLEDAYRYLNFKLSAWYALCLAKTGYMTTTHGYDDVKEGMGEEFYGWFYGGKATYKPIDEVMKEIWPDREEFWTLPERLQHALFLPMVYFRQFWTGEPPRTGSPDPRGSIRDCGSAEDKSAAVRWFAAPDWPDNMDYYVSSYEGLKANLPIS